MIRLLDNSKKQIADQIYWVFQSAYKVEAELIEAKVFPPLARTVAAIQTSNSEFLGFYCQTELGKSNNSSSHNSTSKSELAAVIEIDVKQQSLEIHSLTVAPSHFRKGIADALLDHVFDTYEYRRAEVETAVANTPAIALYKKHGFVEFKRWVPDHGIEKLALSFQYPRIKREKERT